MKNTIIIHGSPDREEYYDRATPSPSNSHWIPWLQKELNFRDEISVVPEMPAPYDPLYSDWDDVISQYVIDTHTTLIGHSSGGGFLLRYLSEHPEINPARVVLIAPWMDPDHELSTPFFDFVIDAEITERTDLHIFTSSDDSDSCVRSFQLLENALPDATYHKYDDRGHFCSAEFSELLDVLE
jgi:hypothetical protein